LIRGLLSTGWLRECYPVPLNYTGREGEVMASTEELQVELVGNVAVLTLNRPERRNALSTSLLVSLASALSELETGREARCVILRGSGDRAFSAGMDLTSVPEGLPTAIQKQIEEKGPLRFGLEAIETFPYPVIALIRGYAVGAGCELAVTCDLRVGSEKCRMGMPPARLGIVYPPEGLQRFMRAVGLPATRKLFYTAKIFEIDEVRAMGLLDYVVPDEELEDRTMEIARGIAGNAPLSVSGHKRSLHLLSRLADISAVDRAELDGLMAGALSSEDAKEGLQAFVQKRDPSFRGE